MMILGKQLCATPLYRVHAQNESQWKSGNFGKGVKVRERSGNWKAMRESQGKSGNFISTTKYFFLSILNSQREKTVKKINWLPAFQVNFCISLTLLSDLPPQQKMISGRQPYILHIGSLLSGLLIDNIKTDSKRVWCPFGLAKKNKQQHQEQNWKKKKV